MKRIKMKGLLVKQKTLCINRLRIIEIISENVGGKTPLPIHMDGFLEYSQVERHRFLIPTCRGSNPLTPKALLSLARLGFYLLPEQYHKGFAKEVGEGWIVDVDRDGKV